MQLFATLNKARPGNKANAVRSSTLIINEQCLWVAGGCLEREYHRFTRIDLPYTISQVGDAETYITTEGELCLLADDGCKLVETVERLVQVSVGEDHTAVLTESGQVWLDWGEGLVHVEIAEAVRQVSAGDEQVALITESGCLWLSHGGGNRFVQISASEALKSSSVGAIDHIAVIDNNGQLWLALPDLRESLSAGHNLFQQLFEPVELSERVTQVSTNHYNTAVITVDGRLLICGESSVGQLGLGDRRQVSRFTLVELAERVVQVSLGYQHTALITENGRLWVAGANNYGELGLGDKRQRFVFTPVSSR